MAIGLARRGANVALVDVDLDAAAAVAEEIRALGVGARALPGDVTSEVDATRCVDAVVAAWGTLDVLLNNAGIAIQVPAEATPLAEFKRVYDIDVNGTFNFAKAAFVPMARQRRGSIVNVASTAAIVAPVPQPQVAYNSAKAAVVMMTKSLAVEWAEHGIRVNAIAPGYMLTAPLEKLIRDDPARYQFWKSSVPMRRVGRPEELEGAAVYLASDASSYVTGHVLVVDGGYTCV
jgi:NAD(P)-dependent dehydrogenase (short-subunit alcohol dehydrogenase family)